MELPSKYKALSPEKCIEIIERRKRDLGSDLLILTHHYQRKELVPFNDFLGDSYALSAKAAKMPAKYIVFCGVHFMAEAADILTGDNQTVYLPNAYAGCPMADMAPKNQVFRVWKELSTIVDTKTVMPIPYMNSTAALKAFCGVNDGLVCTSSNADKAFDYAFKTMGKKKIFFFPDQHLGRNTAKKKGIDPRQVLLWDPRQPLGGYSKEAIEQAKVILWSGHCHVHMNFTPAQVAQRRAENPDVKIVVHPECMEQVVDAADAIGSTKFIVSYVAEQPPGSSIAIGTELNLVDRLIDEYPDKQILPLSKDVCPMCVNMYRTSLNDLAYTLDVIEEGGGHIIRVEEPVSSQARLALDRMIEIS